jgi:hypothetical protein
MSFWLSFLMTGKATEAERRADARRGKLLAPHNFSIPLR